MPGKQLAMVDPAGAPATSRPSAAGLIRPIAAPADVLAAQEETRALIAGALKEGRDFGPVPGVRDDDDGKPKRKVLFKAGADRILAAFGCYAEPEVVEEQVDHNLEVRWLKRKKKWRNAHRGDRQFTWITEEGVSLGLYRYVVRTRIIHRESGATIGWGLGSCSSMESKYVDRPRDSENVVLKMAKKRSVVDGCVSTFGLGDEFTQDGDEARDETTAAAAPVAAGSPGPATAQEDVASDEQLQLIEQLSRSHVWTMKEVRGFERRLGSGLSKVRAAELITWMLQEQKARKLAEAAAGNVPPREPGEDDDVPGPDDA